MYISPDLTPKEREINRQLHTELKRRKQAGETNLMIKRGKIITKHTNSQFNLDHSVPTQNVETQN